MTDTDPTNDAEQRTSDFMHALAAADDVGAANITADGSTVRAEVPKGDVAAAEAVADDHGYESAVVLADVDGTVRCRFDTADDDQQWTVARLADHVDAEIRNPKKGMTLGFIRDVDVDGARVYTKAAGDDGLVGRPAQNVLPLLNADDSHWEVHEGAPLSDL